MLFLQRPGRRSVSNRYRACGGSGGGLPIDGLSRHSSSGPSLEASIVFRGCAIKHFSLPIALVVIQIRGLGRLRQGGRVMRGLFGRFSARRTDLSGRFRGVWVGLAVKLMLVALV